MAKNFITEIREIYENKCLKETLKGNNLPKTVSRLLSASSSVKRANVSEQTGGSKDLSVYTNKVYDIEEVKN